MEKIMGKNLAEGITASVERFLKSLREQATYIDRMFSQFVSTRNMEASFGVQRVVVLLTVVTIIVGIPAWLPILKKIADLLSGWGH